jgi:hypothetical protein
LAQSETISSGDQIGRIRIVPVELPVSWNGKTKLGMMIVHPHIAMRMNNAAFSIEESSKKNLRQTIRDCLSLTTNCGDGKGCEVQVVVFPEFAIPFDSFLEVEGLLRAEGLPRNAVVVAGVEPASPKEFAELLGGSSNPAGSNTLQCGSATFVNFCVIWTKSADGTVRRYLQPKLKPSALEQARQGMYQGEFVLLFQGDLISFAAMICFDCIGETAHMMAAERFLESIGELASHGSSINLGLVLVPQYNEYAEHPDFIRFAQRVLQGNPNVRVSDGAVLFANAATERHGRSRKTFGRSALYYSGGRWEARGEGGPLPTIPFTFALEQPSKPHYGSLVRARLREDGPSVHCLEFLIPSLIGTGSGAPMYPVELAVCHRISTADGRVDRIGKPIHPLHKVFFDWFSTDLPTTEARLACSSSALTGRVAESFRGVYSELEGDSPEGLGRIVDVLFLGLDERTNRHPNLNPDAWQQDAVKWYDESHGKAILQLAVVMTVLGLLGRPDTCTVKGPYTAHTSNFDVSIIDGDDKKSCVQLLQNYSEYAKKSSIATMGGRPNLIILTRTSRCSMPDDLPQIVPDSIQRVSAKDRGALPEELRPKQGDILTLPENRWYWHMGQSIASVLDADGVETAGAALKGKLGTLASA